MIIKYSDHQYVDEKLVIVSQLPYELNCDINDNRFFVVNANDQIIYLDQFNTMAKIFNITNKEFQNFNFY